MFVLQGPFEIPRMLETQCIKFQGMRIMYKAQGKMTKEPRIMLKSTCIMLKSPCIMLKSPCIMLKSPSKMVFDHLRQLWLSIPITPQLYIGF